MMRDSWTADRSSVNFFPRMLRAQPITARLTVAWFCSRLIHQRKT